MNQDKIKGISVFFIVLIFGLFLFACDQDGGDDGDDSSTTTTVNTGGGGGGGGGGINPVSCIPCGDFFIACPMDCKITGCPECFTFDPQSGDMKLVYDDGSYSTSSSDGSMTFYDSTGKQCFRFEIDGDKQTYYAGDDEECYSLIPGPDDGDLTFILDEKEYIYHDDHTWTCPDGSTWELPPSCERAEDGREDSPDVSNCPPVTSMCEDMQNNYFFYHIKKGDRYCPLF